MQFYKEHSCLRLGKNYRGGGGGGGGGGSAPQVDMKF
jgi:hypothetical protein